jgi:hypothetical protein
MKLPLVGESYTLRSPAAAAQQTMNLIPEIIADPNETGKNTRILVGAPGYHLFLTLPTNPLRGIWCGGTSAYAVGGNVLYQLSKGSYLGGTPNSGVGAILNSWTFDSASDGFPVQMFGNGDQLLIVANGYAYIDNGSGPVRCQFQISGYVNTNGTDVQWQSGDDFSTAVAGNYIYIDGVVYSIASVNSATDLTLATSAGVQSGAYFNAPLGSYVTAVTGAYIDGFFVVQRPAGLPVQSTVSTAGTAVTWVANQKFTAISPGDGVAINGVGYVVAAVLSPTSMVLVESAGTQTNVSLGAGVDTGCQFNISAPDNGTSWDPLDFASKEGYPDYLQSIFADREQLYLFGTESSEIWQNTGNALFPFQRISGAAAREGSFCRYAPVSIGGHVYYIGGAPQGQPVAYRLDGFTPVRVSTPAIEQALAAEVYIPEAMAFSYSEDGHQFWVVNTVDQAYVYDATTGEWHQRAFWTGAAFSGYEPYFHCFVQGWAGAASGACDSGMHLVGGMQNGNIYELNLAYFDDNGSAQEWKRILPHLYARGLLQFFGRMTLEMDTGSTSSATVQPTVSRTYSDDRSHTFANPVSPLTGGSGVSSATSQRVYWPSNGSSRDRVFGFSGNNNGNSRTCLIDLDLEVEVAGS